MDAKLFDTLLEPIFILSEDKKIVYCNEAASLICDLSLRKILRSQILFDQLFQFAEPISALSNLAAVSDPTPYQEVAFKTEAEKTGKIQITFQPFNPIEGVNTWIVFFRDVTLEETLQKKYRAELEQKEDVILDLQKAQMELERYSKNLEKMVDERTAEIQKLNQLMTALLDSLGQGFFVFDKSGQCLEVFSKACATVIETKPFGQKIWDVLKLPEKKVSGFQKWMTTIFAEMLPFEDLAPLAPPQFDHSQGHHIQLEYYPLRGPDQKMEGVVVVATDISKLVAAERDAENERAHAKMIITLIQQKRQIVSFLQETESQLSELKSELKKDSSLDPENLFRCLHTLKGGAAVFSVKPMADQAHHSETLLSQWKSNPSAELLQELKESSAAIETHFHHFTAENEQILGSREKLSQRWLELPASKLYQFQNQLSEQLKNQFTRDFLMEPIGDFFQQYQEMSRSVAEIEMKSLAPLSFQNADTPVLPEPYSQLFSTLIHAYRNAIDHGIEFPAVREEKGKPPEGKIETFFHLENSSSSSQSPWLRIEIKDDGGGVDPIKIRTRLKSKGVSVDQESDQQVLQHLFDSQFSTKEVVTELSGRGVGMDAILMAAQNLGGTAWVESKLGEGTTLKVRVPYFLQIPEKIKKAA
jgi:two-component system chemotaxis sensor kinase CheA